MSSLHFHVSLQVNFTKLCVSKSDYYLDFSLCNIDSFSASGNCPSEHYDWKIPPEIPITTMCVHVLVYMC